MRGVVFKIHHGDTSGRIPIVREVMGDAIEIYGGITLNSPVGGFNPFAVDTAIKMGAKMVWMPTISSLNHLEKLGAPHFSGHEADEGCQPQRRGPHYLHRQEAHENPPRSENHLQTHRRCGNLPEHGTPGRG